MFRDCICTTSLYNNIANDFFSNVWGDSYDRDISFISTLRALVAPRMKEGETLNVVFDSSGYDKDSVRSISAARVVSAICGYTEFSSSGQIYIHNLYSDEESNAVVLEAVEKAFATKYAGYYRIEKVTEFFRKQMPVLCFVNPDVKAVAIFVGNLDFKKMHYLQCSIFAFLPWYFNPEQGVTEIEMRLIESLREKTPDKYIECIEKIAEQYDFRTAKIKKLLTGFESKYEKIEITNIKRSIQSLVSNINNCNERIGGYLREKTEHEIRLLGLETKLANTEENSEIMQYFLCNHKLSLVDVGNSSMSFIVGDYITYFDEDMAKTYIDNSRSYIYRRNVLPEEQMRKVMTEIFINQTLRIKVCAAYKFDLQGSVQTYQNYGFGAEYSDYMANPHIDRYNCMGNYVQTINNLLKDRNYIGAIEQCVASCKSLNFADSTVMEEFIRVICCESNKNGRCIELPNGNVVTIMDAVKWIEEQEVTASEQNN